MNQILFTGNENNNRKMDSIYGNGGGNNRNSSSDMKKIIMIFGIVLLVFGICLAGFYGYKMMNNNKVKVPEKPSVSLKYEDGETEVILTAKAEAGISKIIYYWNDEDAEETEGNERTEEQVSITMKKGDNTLTVKVIDINGDEASTSETYHYDKDDLNPTIKTDDNIGQGQIKIIATDETEISYITYKWNDEEETKIEAENEGETTIEATIDVLRGKSTLTITAVDAAGNTETVEKPYKGVNKPIVKVTKKGTQLHMIVKHDMGFEKVEFTVNGQEYVYDENFAGYIPEEKELDYYFDMEEGENIIEVHAVSNEGTEETKKYKQIYEPEE